MKILFFAPYSSVNEWEIPQSILANSLQMDGNEVVYVGCGGLFADYCIVHACRLLTQESPTGDKLRYCNECQGRKAHFTGRLGLKGYDAADILSPADLARVEEALAGFTPENFMEAEFAGLRPGRLGLFDFLIQHRKINLRFDPAEWARYLIHLRNALRAILAAQRILGKERPDRVVVYNTYYTNNHAFALVAQGMDIPVFYIHGGQDFSRKLTTLMIGKMYWHNLVRNRLEHWKQLRHVPLAPHEIRHVANHFQVLLSGQSIFSYSLKRSGAVDIRSRFGIRPGQKVLLAATTSYDEIYAESFSRGRSPFEEGVFPSQLDWLRCLLDFMRGRPDLFLIIRVHPREYLNGAKSVHCLALEELLADQPDNVRVNTPTDNLSLYDLVDDLDVILPYISNIGWELSLLGLPSVFYSEMMLNYPGDFNYRGTDRADYLAKIDQALAEGWSFERIRHVFRWLALNFCKASLDLGPFMIATPTHMDIRWEALAPIPAANRVIIENADSLLDLHEGEPDLDVHAIDVETASLKECLAEFCAVMYPDRDTALSRQLRQAIGHPDRPTPSPRSDSAAA